MAMKMSGLGDAERRLFERCASHPYACWLVALVLVAGLGLRTEARAQAMPMGGEHEAMNHAPGKPSTSLVVTVDGKATTFSAAELKAMTQTTLTAKNGHTQMEETYVGVSVGELLAKCGFAFDSKTAKRVYQSYVRAEGTDGYWVLYSASELMPVLRETGSIVALGVDGKGLGDEGEFKIVIAGEKRPARWVRNLKSLTVVTVEQLRLSL
jgi:hypothetical protein